MAVASERRAVVLVRMAGARNSASIRGIKSPRSEFKFVRSLYSFRGESGKGSRGVRDLSLGGWIGGLGTLG